MKKVVVIVAVVLAIVVLSPFVTGRMTECALQDAIKLQENPWVAIEIADYDRGWFSSEATVRYRFSDSYQQMLNTALGEAASTAGDGAEVAFDGALLTPLTIDHGLVFLSNGLGFGLNRMSGNLDVSQFDVLSDFQTLAGVDSLMTFSSTTGLTGASSFDIASPQIAIDEDGTQFSFQGFSADGTAQLTTGQVDMEGTMPGLSIVSTGGDEPMNLTIGETRMTADVQQHSTYVTVGDVSFVMSEIAVEGDDAKVVFTDLAVEQSTTLSEAGLLDIDVVYKLAGLTGPEVSVDDMLVNLEMDNIRPEALEAYMDYNQKMTDQIMQAAANPDAASVDSEAVMAEMASMVHQVLQGSPELRITPMSAVIDGEQVAANMDLRFDASVLPALDQFNFMDLAMWKQMLSFDADVALPVAMAEQMMRSSARTQMQAAVAQSGQEMTEEQIDQMVDAQLPMMLGMLEQQGMMIKSESGYASTAKFADGQLTVNGNLIPLPF